MNEFLIDNRLSQYSETELPSMFSHCIRSDNCSRFRSLLRKQIVDVNAVIEGEGTLLHNAAFKGRDKNIVLFSARCRM